VRREAEATAARVLRALQARTEANAEPRDDLPTGLLDDGSMPSLAEAYDAWDAVRARTALTAPSTGPAWRRGLAFARRTALRLRDLGVLWDRERDLLRALMARIDALERRVDEASRKESG
jgi:hypothetical protein